MNFFKNMNMSFLDLYMEYLTNYKYKDEFGKETCLDIFRNSLRTTGHIAKVTAVAWGAVCTYAARLMSTIGVRATIRENVPGKGSDEHKILALATLKLARRIRERGVEDVDANLHQILNDAIKDTEYYIDEVTDKTREDLLSILRNFIELYKDISIKMRLSNNVKFYAELQLLDYETHMWGTPDVILEDPVNRKAILIDWKTAGDTPTQREKYQIYAYAILEALRLGYKPSEVFAAIAPDDLGQTKIYYAIIRPNNAYSDHPFHPLSSTRPLTAEELRNKLRHVIDIGLYMTSLVVDYGVLFYGKLKLKENYELRKEMMEACAVRLGDNEYFSLRLTPPSLPRGSPTKQQGWQCNLCPFSDKNSKLQECRFYFGSKAKNLIDSLMWRYRWIVYGERENALVPYRVLYEVGRKASGMQNLINKLKNGRWYEVIIKNGNISIRERGKVSPRTKRYKHRCGVIEVEFEEIGYTRDIRLGLYKVVPLGKESLLLLRDYLPCEVPEDGEVMPAYGIRERQPVIITLPEPHVSTPTLGMVLTAKVEQIFLRGDVIYEHECPGMCAVVVPISSNLRFPFKLLREYIELYGVEEVFVSEVGSDLTHIDLATIHSMHMMLKKVSGNEKISKALENRRIDLLRIEQTVEQAWKEVFETLSEAR